MALSLGTLVAGRYEITAPIAVGGMGEVWRARDRVLDRTVAAKVLRSEYTGDPNFLARFRNEARHTAALSHPNIASVYDYGETVDERSGANLAFLVMEFVDGQPLVTILHEEGKLPVDWTLHVVGQAADGLSAAHRAGVVHRDIKPGNLMVRPDGVVKLTDFGIAQARDAAPLTRTGMVVGTAQYLSPEQAQGLEVTAASDVYSLGVVAYECLSGVRPFDGTSQVAIALAHINRPPPPLPGDVPPAVSALVSRALAKDPVQRFPDGGAFAEAVRNVAKGGRLAPAPAPTGATTEVIAVPDGATQVFGGGTGAVPAAASTAARPMPPLQASPVDGGPDDEPWAGKPRAGAPRRGRWIWVAAVVAVLLLLGGGAYLLLGGGDGAGSGEPTARTSPSASAPPPAATSAPPPAATVAVDTSGFIGEDYDTVRRRLEGQGLAVTRKEASSALLTDLDRQLNRGTVAGSDPADTSVPVGSTVTLFVASDGFSPGDGDGGGTSVPPQQTTPRQTTAPKTTTSTPTQTTASTKATTTTGTTAPSSSTASGTPAPPPSDQAPGAGASGQDTGGAAGGAIQGQPAGASGQEVTSGGGG